MKTLVCFAVAALACLFIPHPAIAGDDDHCLWTKPDSKEEVRYAVGETWTTPSCTSTSCIMRDGQPSLATIGCGLISIRPNCHISEPDTSKPYPDCCYKEVCPKN
ncbi:hypothetical protein J437_LFUL012978 [Ladona fulva]|uniref:Single domain-containing protein n=1 Tax=Ladona fulva TaxID=123851 RepID=A0A8K0KCU3_LADFU|nr:hypothetical protein J437_LFUL012978 [Ladona fulva]